MGKIYFFFPIVVELSSNKIESSCLLLGFISSLDSSGSLILVIVSF